MPPHTGIGSNVLAPVNARYRVTTWRGLSIDGWPYAEGDEIEKDSPLRQQPELIRMLVDQKKLTLITEED